MNPDQHILPSFCPYSSPPESPCQLIVNYPVWSDSDDDDDATVDDTAAAAELFGLVTNPSSRTTQQLPDPDQQEVSEPIHHHEPEPTADVEMAGAVSDGTSDAEETPSPAKRSRRYAMTEKELPPKIVALLKEVKTFFTKPLNLKRFGPAISTTTYDKALERIRGKYVYYQCKAHEM